MNENELTKNQLVTRRGFFQRTADGAKAAGISAIWLGLEHRAPAAPAAANPWAYDDSAFRKTDPKLIRFHELRRFPSHRPSPRCLALTPDDRLFIGAGKFVTEHSPSGSKLSELSLSAEVRCLATGRDGTLFVGLRDRVEVYDPGGDRRAAWQGSAGRSYFTGITVGDQDVFVADAGNRVVLRYDREGKLKNRIGEKKKQTPGFIVPSPFFDVKLGHDGLLRVTNPGRHQVEAYTFDGDLELAWGKPGAAIENFCGCCNPIKLALLADGRVVTIEKGIPRVKVYAADGTFECVVAGSESFAENAKVCGPNDCTLGGLDGALDSKGHIYILDFVAGDVRVMERNPA